MLEIMQSISITLLYIAFVIHIYKHKESVELFDWVYEDAKDTIATFKAEEVRRSIERVREKLYNKSLNPEYADNDEFRKGLIEAYTDAVETIDLYCDIEEEY